MREELFFRKGCFAVKFTTRSDAPVALELSSSTESERLIHRIPKMIPVMALTVVWNVEYGRR